METIEYKLRNELIKITKSPGIVLVSKFETGKNNNKNKIIELQKFIDYISREEAIKDKNSNNEKYTTEEIQELARIEEALKIMSEQTEQPVIQDIVQMEKYINYMTRSKAIKENSDHEFLNGSFSNTKRYITKDDVRDIKKSVVSAKENGSVMFQDVVSFDNDFLEQEGLYNKKNGDLNEEALYLATKGMMDTLIKKEKLVNSFWFATIHRNTDHIHIHTTLMEEKNTREVINYKGVEQARGKRKQSSLDEMLFKFGSTILDRTTKFERLSQLRKEIPFELKEETKGMLSKIYQKHNQKSENNLEKKIEELIEIIPTTTKGYNALPKGTQNKIDEVTEYMTKNSSKKKEYDETTKLLDNLYQSVYGNKYEKNSFYNNRQQDFNERVGNAIVLQIKNSKKQQESIKEGIANIYKEKKFFKNRNPSFKTELGKKNYDTFKQKQEIYNKNFDLKKKHIESRNKHFKNKRTIRQLNQVINDNLDMYNAKQDFEKAQKMVAAAQQNNYPNFEI